VHGGLGFFFHGYGSRNPEGEMLQDISEAMFLIVTICGSKRTICKKCIRIRWVDLAIVKRYDEVMVKDI